MSDFSNSVNKLDSAANTLIAAANALHQGAAQGSVTPQSTGGGTSTSPDYNTQIRQLQQLEQAFGQGQTGARTLRQELEHLSTEMRSGSQNAGDFLRNFASDRIASIHNFTSELTGAGQQVNSLTDLLSPGGLSAALGRNGVGAAFLIAADAAHTYNDAVTDEATRVALQTTAQDVGVLTTAIARLKDAQDSELEGYDRRIAALQTSNSLMERRQTLARMDADLARDSLLAQDVFSSAGQSAGARLPDEIVARDNAAQRYAAQDQLDALQLERATAKDTGTAKINTQQDAINAARAAALLPGATPQTIQQSIDNTLYPTGRPLNPPPGYPQAPYSAPPQIAAADPGGVTTKKTVEGIIGPVIDLNKALGQFEYDHGLASRDATTGEYTFQLPGSEFAGKTVPPRTPPLTAPVQTQSGLSTWLDANNPFNAIPNAWNNLFAGGANPGGPPATSTVHVRLTIDPVTVQGLSASGAQEVLTQVVFDPRNVAQLMQHMQDHLGGN